MTTPQPQQPVDPVTAFWRDVMARSGMPMPSFPGTAGGAGGAAPNGAGAGGPPPGYGWAPTPDVMKRMQAAWFDAMAEYADQYMRSPQFLESMKRSMEQAVGLRQQMEEFLKTSMGASLMTAGPGATTEILSAVARIESTMRAEMASLAERLSRLEKAAGVQEEPKTPAAMKKPAKPAAK